MAHNHHSSEKQKILNEEHVEEGCHWWTSKTTSSQFAICLIPMALLFAGTVVMSTLYVMELQNNGTNSSQPTADLCTTPDCIIAAGQMLMNMDKSAPPCQDFFQYACGGFSMRNQVPAGQNKLMQFDFISNLIQQQLRGLLEDPNPPKNEMEARQKSRRYYKSCLNRTSINQDSVARMQQLVNDIGGLYLTKSSQLPNDWAFDTLMAWRNMYSTSSFFALSAGADDKNVSQNIIQISQGGLGLGASTRDYYVNVDVRKDPVMVAYATMLTTYAQLIVGKDNVDMDMVFDAVQFEQTLAQNQLSQADMRDVNAIYNKVTIGWLQQNAGFMQWVPFFNSMFQMAKFSVDETQPVLLYATPYLQNLTTVVQSMLSTAEGKRTLQNYVVLMAINDYGSKLSDDFQAAYNAFQTAFNGVQGTLDTWQICVTDTDATIGYPLGGMYTDKYFGDDAKKKASFVIDNIIATFRVRVQNNPWMDDVTKKQALDKFDYLKHDVGYPDWIDDATYVNAMYANFTVSDDYVANQFASFMYQTIQMGTMVKNVATDPRIWTMTPPTVNAYYEPTQNKFVVPAGILNPPFFFQAPGVPDLISFAAIGTVTGHEITHGFDDQGAQYDKYGNLNNWWSNQTLAEFNKRTKCLADQYGSYPGQFTKYSIGINVNGVQTLGENIADNGGIKTAFQAYRTAQAAGKLNLPQLVGLTDLTPDQLFFVGYAQVWCSIYTPGAMKEQIQTNPHSPPVFRVIGPLSNSEDFTNAFNCPAASPMNPNPNARCAVW